MVVNFKALFFYFFPQALLSPSFLLLPGYFTWSNDKLFYYTVISLGFQLAGLLSLFYARKSNKREIQRAMYEYLSWHILSMVISLFGLYGFQYKFQIFLLVGIVLFLFSTNRKLQTEKAKLSEHMLPSTSPVYRYINCLDNPRWNDVDVPVKDNANVSVRDHLFYPATYNLKSPIQPVRVLGNGGIVDWFRRLYTRYFSTAIVSVDYDNYEIDNDDYNVWITKRNPVNFTDENVNLYTPNVTADTDILRLLSKSNWKSNPDDPTSMVTKRGSILSEVLLFLFSQPKYVPVLEFKHDYSPGTTAMSYGIQALNLRQMVIGIFHAFGLEGDNGTLAKVFTENKLYRNKDAVVSDVVYRLEHILIDYHPVVGSLNEINPRTNFIRPKSEACKAAGGFIAYLPICRPSRAAIEYYVQESTEVNSSTKYIDTVKSYGTMSNEGWKVWKGKSPASVVRTVHMQVKKEETTNWSSLTGKTMYPLKIEYIKTALFEGWPILLEMNVYPSQIIPWIKGNVYKNTNNEIREYMLSQDTVQKLPVFDKPTDNDINEHGSIGTQIMVIFGTWMWRNPNNNYETEEVCLVRHGWQSENYPVDIGIVTYAALTDTNCNCRTTAVTLAETLPGFPLGMKSTQHHFHVSDSVTKTVPVDDSSNEKTDWLRTGKNYIRKASAEILNRSIQEEDIKVWNLDIQLKLRKAIGFGTKSPITYVGPRYDYPGANHLGILYIRTGSFKNAYVYTRLMTWPDGIEADKFIAPNDDKLDRKERWINFLEGNNKCKVLCEFGTYIDDNVVIRLPNYQTKFWIKWVVCPEEMKKDEVHKFVEENDGKFPSQQDEPKAGAWSPEWNRLYEDITKSYVKQFDTSISNVITLTLYRGNIAESGTKIPAPGFS